MSCVLTHSTYTLKSVFGIISAVRQPAVPDIRVTCNAPQKTGFHPNKSRDAPQLDVTQIATWGINEEAEPTIGK